MEKKIPMRMCIACKANKPKKEHIRIVKNDEGIALDKTGRKNGRGAYICNDPACVQKLKKQKILNRVFSMPVDDVVYDKIVEDFFGKDN